MRGYSGRKLWSQNNWKVVFCRSEIPTEVSHMEEGRICDRALKMGPLFVTSGPEKHIPYLSSVNNALPYYLQGSPYSMPTGYAAIDIKPSADKMTRTADWYRMFAYLLGITVTLLGLTSLQIVNIKKWITCTPPRGQWSGESAEDDDCLFPVKSGDAAVSKQPMRSRRPAAPRETNVGGITRASVAPDTRSNWVSSETQSQVLPGCDCRSCCPDFGGSAHGVEPFATDYWADGDPPLTESFQAGRDVWPNCPHFTNGIHQVCLLCWLNCPDLWLFGPTLPPLASGSGPFSFCAHCGRECDCQSPLTASSPCSTALVGLSSALSDTELLRRHVCHRVDMAFAVQSKTDLLLLKRLQIESYDQPVSSGALPKYPRSSGDGAPSSSLLDLSLENSGRSKGSPVIATKSECQSIARPLFYTADSDSESSASLLHQWISTEVDLGSPSRTVDTEQLRISVSKLTSKVTVLLQSAGCRRRLVAATSELGSERSPPTVAAAGLGSHRRKEITTSVVHPGSSSCPYDFSSETLEYDDFLPALCSRQSFADSDTSDCQSVELTEEDDAMLLNLLDTLNSLMHLKHGSSPTPRRQTSQPTMANDGGADGGMPATRNYSLCEAVQASFSDLSKKATDLAEDLATLEEVLDQLHYKVCANEIELANAKDNLATAWHLHDNLGSADSVSSIGGGTSATSLVCSLCEDSQSSSPESSRRLSVRCDGRSAEPSSPVAQPTPRLSIAPVETGYSAEPPVLRDSATMDSRTTASSLTKSITESTYPSSDSASLLAIPAVMTMSAPDGGQLNGEFTTAVVTTSTSTTGDSLRRTSKSRRLRSARCRLHRPACSARDVRRSEDLSCLYYSRVDPDGFLHPELAFEKDGLVDWETIVSSQKRQSELTVSLPVRGSPDAASPIP